MNKYILGIDGLNCGMCEAHVENVIRKNINVKKVKASHIKNQVVVFTEKNLSEYEFHNVLDPTGYKITSFERAVPVKTFLGWK